MVYCGGDGERLMKKIYVCVVFGMLMIVMMIVLVFV